MPSPSMRAWLNIASAGIQTVHDIMMGDTTPALLPGDNLETASSPFDSCTLPLAKQNASIERYGPCPFLRTGPCLDSAVYIIQFNQNPEIACPALAADLINCFVCSSQHHCMGKRVLQALENRMWIWVSCFCRRLVFELAG